MNALAQLERDVAALEAGLDSPSTPALAALADSVAWRVLDGQAVVADDGPEFAVRALLAANHEIYRSGHVARSGELLRAALERARGTAPKTHIMVLLRCAEHELLVYDIAAAMVHTSEAMAIARRAGRPVDEARARANYAMALDAAGLFPQADEHWSRALATLEGCDEPRLVGNIWAQRCPLGFRLQAVDEAAAEESCRRALEAALASPARYRDAMACTALANWAALDIQRGRLAEALARIERAGAYPNLGLRPRWLLEVLRAMVAVRERNGGATRAVLAALLDEPRVPAVYVIETLSVLAAMYADMGDAVHAAETLKRLSAERSRAMWAMLRGGGIGTEAAPVPGPEGESESMAQLVRLAVIAELRDDATGRHCFRVGRLARLLGERAGLPAAKLAALDIAARLHDLGKLAIPDGILLKPGRLDPTEHHLMRAHAAIGEEILRTSALPGLESACAIARHHHERWDGAGYPDGLAGEAIPIEARVAALADVYDALTHPRPYKEAWSHAQAVAYIAAESGGHFDPALAATFLAMMAEAERDFDRFLAGLESAAEASAVVVAQARAARLADPFAHPASGMLPTAR